MDNFIVIIPKNKSLKECRILADKVIKEEGIIEVAILEIRAEDIPFFVSKLLKRNEKVIGISGEDLFEEWKLANPSEHLDIIRRYEWKDKEALFKKPVLCLLGPKTKKLKDLPKKLKIAISDKYKNLSNIYLDSFRKEGYTLEIMYFSGCVEQAYAYGIADVIIDIIYTGKSAEQVGLTCYEKIYESDIIIMGYKNLLPSIPKINIIK